jgi:hypothetical protein
VSPADLDLCGMQSESRNASASKGSTPDTIAYTLYIQQTRNTEGERRRTFPGGKAGRHRHLWVGDLRPLFQNQAQPNGVVGDSLAQPSWPLNRLSPPVTRPASLALSLIIGHMPCRSAGGEVPSRWPQKEVVPGLCSLCTGHWLNQRARQPECTVVSAASNAP